MVMVAVRGVACGMRSFLFFLFPRHSFFLSPPSDSLVSRFRRKKLVSPPCEGTLRDNANRYPLPLNGITLRGFLRVYPGCVRQASFESPTIALAHARVRERHATPWRWRTCEYPIFTASHFPLSCLYLIFHADPPCAHSSLPFSIFPRCLSSRELFSCLVPSSCLIFTSSFSPSHSLAFSCLLLLVSLSYF